MILRDKAIVEHASVAGRSLCSAGARRLTLCVGGESAAGRQAITRRAVSPKNSACSFDDNSPRVAWIVDTMVWLSQSRWSTG